MLGTTARRRWRRRAGAVRRRAETVTVGTAGVLVLTLAAASTAAAQVVRDPTGSVAVATAGESAYAKYVAVSNGGTASGDAVAVSHGGQAWSSCFTIELVCLSGLAVSTTNSAYGHQLGLSGTGTGSSSYVGGSGTGTGQGNVALSGTGPGNGTVAAVSGTGAATGPLAISGTGNATASNRSVALGVSQPGVAVAPGGNANGGTAGVTVWGDSSGGTASVDPDRTVGTGTGTGWSTLKQAAGFHHTGLNLYDSAYQATVTAQMPPPNPAGVAEKTKGLAELMPEVTARLAANDGAWVFSATRLALEVQMYNGCVPQSLHATYAHRGMPSQHTLWWEMRIYESNGATMKHAVGVARKYYSGPAAGVPQLDRAYDPTDLFARVVYAVSRHDQGAIISVHPPMMWSWGGSGGTGGGHAVSVWGYSYEGDGWLLIGDGVDNPDEYAQPGEGYGTHFYRLSDLYMAWQNEIIW